MDMSIDLQELKRHAEAATVTLGKLKKQRDDLNRQIGELIEPITMLENVVSAWQRLDPNRTKQEELLSMEGAPMAEKKGKRPYGQVVKHINQVLADGHWYSPEETHHEIVKRFNVTHREAAVAVALRRGKERGKLARSSEGKYRLKEKP